MTNDDRVPFEEAVVSFKEALSSQGWPTSILWLSSERITGHKRNYWILRPEELISEDASKIYYEETRKEDWNLGLEAFAPYKNHALAYVARKQGKSRMLNFSFSLSEDRIQFVHSKTYWLFIRFVCHLRGLSPFLKYSDMMPHH